MFLIVTCVNKSCFFATHSSTLLELVFLEQGRAVNLLSMGSLGGHVTKTLYFAWFSNDFLVFAFEHQNNPGQPEVS